MATNTGKFHTGQVLALTALLAIPVVAWSSWQWYLASRPDPVDYVRALNGYLRRMPPVDRMNERFVDKDGDLVPDGPRDPKAIAEPAVLLFSPGVQGRTETEADWAEFLDRLKKATGIDVRIVEVDGFQDALDKMNSGQLHIASFSAGSIPTAVNAAGFVPAVALADATGKSDYRMTIIVPTASTAKSPADLAGKRVYLTSTGSHSGFKAPLIILNEEFRLRPGLDYSYVLSGSHPASIAAIAKGGPEVAAAVADDVLADAVSSGLIKENQYRSIYQSKPMPKGAFGYSCCLPPTLIEKIRSAFLSHSLEGTRLGERYKGSQAAKFVPVDYRNAWEYIREIDAKMLAWK